MRNGTGTWGEVIWAWTLGNLPGWLVLPGFLASWSQPLRIDTKRIKADDLPKGVAVDLLLGPDLLLEKHLTLPVAARANLPRAIDLNMRQSLPGGGVDLLWSHGAGKREGSRLDIPVYLLRKTALAEIKAMASSHGGRVRTVAVANDPSARPFWDNRKRHDLPRRFWGKITAVLVIALAGAIIWQETSQIETLHSQIDALESEKSDLSNQAVELRAKLDAENTSIATISRDLEIFRVEFHRLPILLDLTEALSDETWVSDLAISGTDIRLSGFTTQDVTEVMAAIRELSWVQRVDLDGPVSFDSFSRQNRFDLLVGLHAVEGMSP